MLHFRYMSTQEREDKYTHYYGLTPEARKILSRGGSLVGRNLGQEKEERLKKADLSPKSKESIIFKATHAVKRVIFRRH